MALLVRKVYRSRAFIMANKMGIFDASHGQLMSNGVIRPRDKLRPRAVLRVTEMNKWSEPQPRVSLYAGRIQKEKETGRSASTTRKTHESEA